jgi:Mor family transcriptional regulator
MYLTKTSTQLAAEEQKHLSNQSNGDKNNLLRKYYISDEVVNQVCSKFKTTNILIIIYVIHSCNIYAQT